MTNQLKKIIKFFLWIPYKILKKVTDRLLSPLYEKLDQVNKRLDRTNAATRVALQQSNYIYNLTYITPLQNEYSIPKRFNVKRYVPDYGIDSAQSHIVTNNTFNHLGELLLLDKYIDENSIVLDIGANIGCWTLYWAIIRNVTKIVSFEPIPTTYSVLAENIKLNNLENRVQSYNYGLGEYFTKGKITNFSSTSSRTSTIEGDKKGSIQIFALDELDLKLDRIDFMKIDTEGFEEKVLAGAKSTIQKYKPIIAIEIWDEEVWYHNYQTTEGAQEHFDKMVTIFSELDYKFVERISRLDCVFIPKET